MGKTIMVVAIALAACGGGDDGRDFGAAVGLDPLPHGRGEPAAHAGPDALGGASALEIWRELEIYRAQHPGATHKELTSCVDELVSSAKKNAGNQRSWAMYDDLVADRLNDQEEELWTEDRVVGVAVLAAAQSALMGATELWERKTLYLGNGDAFRHALWNILMVAHVGSNWARRWADAHEYGASRNGGADMKMDLKNNAIGRNFADRYGTRATSVLVPAIHEGRLVRVVNGELVPTDSTGWLGD